MSDHAKALKQQVEEFPTQTTVLRAMLEENERLRDDKALKIELIEAMGARIEAALAKVSAGRKGEKLGWVVVHEMVEALRGEGAK